MIPIIILQLKEAYDQQMMLELYEKHNQMMYSIALGYTRNETDAQDVLQNTWISLCTPQCLETLHTFTEERQDIRKRYIARCVRNKSIDFLRKHKRRKHNEIPLDTDTIADAVAGDASFVTTLELRDELTECMAGIQELPPKQKLYLTLYYLENQSFREIARTLCKTEDSVRSQVSEAKRNLLRRLRQRREKYDG